MFWMQTGYSRNVIFIHPGAGKPSITQLLHAPWEA